MTAHKNHTGDVDTLLCHYCGHAVRMPERCPSCGSPYIAAFGLGTQKVEEMLGRRFPTARILRMDADTTAGKHGHEHILSEFRAGNADILIGTQMIVKGHDFPNVTLVAALAADMSMFDNDFRSSERTFQLLMQASGRAGRGEKSGEVVIQTYQPEHYVIASVAAQDAELFYNNELAYRRMMEYPPYGEMIAVSVSAQTPEAGEACLARLAKRLQDSFGGQIKLIGPAPAAVKRVKDRFRLGLYVKAQTGRLMEQVRSGIEAWKSEEDDSNYMQYEVF